MKFDIAAVILNSTQQPGCVVVTRFCTNSFRPAFWLQLWVKCMAAPESYYFQPNMLQTLEMIALKMANGKEIISRKKKHFADLARDAEVSCNFFSFPPILSGTEWSHKNMNIFRIVGTSEAKTLVSGNAECLLAMDKDKKRNSTSSCEWTW